MQKILVFIILIPQITFCQNLIKNGSFEDFAKCPFESGQIEFCKHWYCPNNSSPDYFVNCSTNIISEYSLQVPNNFNGFQEAKTGNAYIGIVTLYKDLSNIKGVKFKNEYVEYIQTRFKKPLIEGERYLLKMYINCADSSKYYNNYLEFCFTEDSIFKQYDVSRMLICNNCIKYQDLSAFTDKLNWQEISVIYTAQGNELFLTIGIFYHDGIFKEIKSKLKTNLFFSNKRNEESAYYYIDDISLVPIDSLKNEIVLYPELIENCIQPSINNFFKLDKALVGQSYTLNNISFEFDKAELLPNSYSELNDLKQYLNNNRNLKIEIQGYTDNLGDYDYNLALSINRAKSVYDYLVEQGADPKQLSYKGFGNNKPIASNESEEGKAKNRRVEIEIIEQ